MTDLSKDQFASTTNTLLAAASVWALAVCAGATSGFLASLYRPVIGAIVAVIIIVPTRFRDASDESPAPSVADPDLT